MHNHAVHGRRQGLCDDPVLRSGLCRFWTILSVFLSFSLNRPLVLYMCSTALPTKFVKSMAQTAPHVVVIGGGYGGMSVISNLVNLYNGGKQLPCPVPIPELNISPMAKPRITLLDGRDGICAPDLIAAQAIFAY